MLYNIKGSRLSPSKKNKIELDCPFCTDNKAKKYKMMINVDWSCKVKCYRCGKAISIFSLAKKLGFYDEFLTFIQSLSTYSLLELKNIIRSNDITVSSNNIIDENHNKLSDFIKSHGMLDIKKIKYAYDYAMSRVYNSKTEVEKYLADEKYIYIPLTYEDNVISYMGRLYNDDNMSPRYKMVSVNPEIQPIGFIDDVVENYGNDSIYITEGYFDSFAVNYSFGNYVSISSLGKGKKDNLICTLSSLFPPDTKIYLTLDSPKKDAHIYENNISFGEKLSKYYSSVYIVELDESDPADILANRGPIYLKKCLIDNVKPLFKYMIKNKLKNIKRK